MKILTKRQNYQLWQSGAFGNKLRAWRTIEELERSGFANSVVLRALLREGGGPCQYGIPPGDVPAWISKWLTSGLVPDVSNIMINEEAPESDVLLQGEYLNDIHLGPSPNWGYFLYSWERMHMRNALKASSHVSTGIRSDLLIKEAMSPASYDDWRDLLDKYPGHVFEVSIYRRYLGGCPRRNALIWEIRRY